jgi:hypothetical protein
MTPLTRIAQLVAGSPGLATVAAVSLVGVTLLLFAWAVGRVAATPGTAAALERPASTRQPMITRLSDPDTAGRPRPRAPSASPAPARIRTQTA